MKLNLGYILIGIFIIILAIRCFQINQYMKD